MKLLIQRARSPVSSRRIRDRSIRWRRLPPPSAMFLITSAIVPNFSERGLAEDARNSITVTKAANAFTVPSNHRGTPLQASPKLIDQSSPMKMVRRAVRLQEIERRR